MRGLNLTWPLLTQGMNGNLTPGTKAKTRTGLATEALEEAQVEAQVEEATETQGQPRWHLHLRADL